MDPVTTALAVGLLCLLVYRFLWISTTSFEKRGIEHTKPWLIVGNMAPVLFRRQFYGDYLRNVYFKFRDLKYFGFYNLVAPIIVIRDPELITSIAVKNFDHFTDHIGFVNEEMDPLMGKNLFALRGDRWKEMRKLLSPAFTSAKMKSMFKLIVDCAERTNAFISQDSKKGRAWDMQDLFRRYANDVVATTSFGIAVDSLKDPDNEFYKLGRESLNFSTWVSLKMMMGRNFPTISRLLGITIFGSKPRKFFTKVVAETTRMREEKGIHRPDMIQLMMDSRDKDGKRLTVDEMTNQAFIFFLGGFDTSTLMMCMVAQMIATNPEVQSKVLLEVEEAHRKMAEAQPIYDVIKEMTYMDAVIDETLRMYPVVPFLDRICVKEFELPPAKPGAKSVSVKPGESLWFLPTGIHHDTKYYKDPENFRPERFLNGEVSTNTYIPFGLGPRVCIGNRFAMMEAKILFCLLLKNCVLEPCEKTTVPLKFSKKSIMVLPPNGYWLNIRTKEEESVANGHVANGKANDTVINIINSNNYKINVYLNSVRLFRISIQVTVLTTLLHHQRFRITRKIISMYSLHYTPLTRKTQIPELTSTRRDAYLQHQTSQVTCLHRSSFHMSDRRYDFSCARESVPKGSPTNYNQNRSDKNSAEMDPVTTALAVGLLCLLVYRFLWISTTSFEKRGIEHTKPWLIVGNMAPVLFRRQFYGDYLRNVYFKFRDLKYFGFYNLVAPIIVIRDPELITSIAVKNFDHFTDHIGFVNEEMDPLMGKNLFALRGDRWKEMRKLLSPAFTSAKMKSMFKLIVDCAERTNAFISQDSKKGRAWDMQDLFRRYANDVVATTSFGIAVDSMKDPDNEFYKLGRESINFSTWVSLKMMMGRNFPTISRLLGITIFGSKPRKFFTKVVAETTRMREEKGIHRPDMIQLMMDSRDKDGKRLTVDEMTNQAFIFFAAGFDTSALMMCIVAQMIATNSEVQSKVLLEVEEAHRKMAAAQPIYDVIKEMTYMDAVIDETLRIYPIASFLDRICVKEFELPPAKPGAKSVTVKPGESLWFLPTGLHHDPKYYKDPENFRPERFLNGEVSANTYIPFGLGPRFCIGNRFAMMEAKILFCLLLKNCVLEPCEKTTVPLKFSKKSIMVLPPNGYWLNIRTKEEESVANGHVANGKANDTVA
ncbi:uncharacterized protein LOC143219416 [Lasioglossum baleicum]|uniref:uncharacterized protein LOC143219416 n=1 Tax=Lasioglossum baleicum TaxID=434251 RepID=UPI003FCC9761